MPLTELVNTLNSPHVRKTPSIFRYSGLEHPFVAADGRVFIHYAGIRLESKFLPIVNTVSGAFHGHASTIQAFGLANNIPMMPEAVFVLPSDDEEFVHLDRLVRTLHALNYLTRPTRGNLLLRVHPRHILSVPANHGLAFEEILRPSGLFPDQITLEIDTDTDAVENSAHFVHAIASYRSRGYSIAVSNFGRTQLDFGFLREIQPDIVKLSPFLLGSSRPLGRIIDNIHKLQARVLIEGIDTGKLCQSAADLDVDLLQAHTTDHRTKDENSSTTGAGQPGIRDAA